MTSLVLSIIYDIFAALNIGLFRNVKIYWMIYWNIAKLYCQDVLAYLQYDRDKLINFYLLNEKNEFIIIECSLRQ